MKQPKFHPGDRVTVITPYVAPIPEDIKDSEIFEDLYKLFGLDKDIRGVKSGDTYTIIGAESKPRTRTDGKTVYAYSYQGKSGKRSGYILWEDEIKLAESAKPAPEADDDEPDTVTIEIEVDLNDKAKAHRVAHNAVELAFKAGAAISKAVKEPAKTIWTDDEIAAARKKVVELSSKITEQGGDMIFQRIGDNTIACGVYASSFDIEPEHKGYAKPFDHDPFNEWIGKCVAACKAMGEPIPGFISHKNTKWDAA